MNAVDEIGDSQSDDGDMNNISWQLIEKDKYMSTRKEKQLEKLQRDLQPLTNEFKDAPITRNRNSSFQKNNQFTVVAAEFLNLSSKSELNRLFENGISKDDIENMLEQKYQEKKQFFTDAGVKHHKFKRKSFESWRSMSNSNATSVNTFMSEEELFNQLDGKQKTKLKRLNNQPLQKFRKFNTENKDVSYRNNERLPKEQDNRLSTTKLRNIPVENGLLEINKTAKDTSNESKVIHIRPNNEHQLSDQHDYNDSLEITGQYMSNTIDLEINQKNSHRPDPAKDRDIQDKNTQNFESPIHGGNSNEIVFSHSEDEFDSDVNTKSNFMSEKNNSTIIHDDSLQILSSPIVSSLKSKSVISPPGPERRSFRHRNILNRNPYLVDRAQFFGLATTDELMFMEERGDSESKILEYLEKQYQKGRMSKTTGYNTFYDVVTDQNQGKKNNADEADTQTFEPLNSDEDSDFSIDDDIDDVEDGFGVDSNIEGTGTNLDMSIIAEESDSKKSATKISKTLSKTYPKLDDNIPKRKSEKNNKSLKSALLGSPTKIKTKTRIDVNTVHDVIPRENKLKYRREIKNVNENPYSMEFLTLSDEDNAITPIISPETDLTRNRSVGSVEYDKNEIVNPYEKKRHNIVSNLNLKVGMRSGKPKNLTLKRKLDSSNQDMPSNTLKKKKKSSNLGLIGNFAPLEDDAFVFNRQPVAETVQLEISNKTMSTPSIYDIVLPFDVNNARRSKADIIGIAKQSGVLEENSSIPEVNKIWDTIEYKSVGLKRLMFITKLKRNSYSSLIHTDKFLGSPLLLRTLSTTDYFYRKKSIQLIFLGSKIKFEVPLKSDTLSKISAFLNLLSGAMKENQISKDNLKEIRKSLIHIMMVISNIKQDCMDILEKVGLELNHCLNVMKKVNIGNLNFCIIAPFFLLYMITIQKYLPSTSEYYSSFKNTQMWLEKKFWYHFLKIPFETVFIHKNSIMMSSLILFQECSSTKLSEVEFQNMDIFNYLNILYYNNREKNIEQRWNSISNMLNYYGNSISQNEDTLLQIKGIFIGIQKLSIDFNWTIEDQLLVQMFRVLAEYKFDNIGSLLKPKASIYPNSVTSVGLSSEDGCLDIFFKLLELFGRQYMLEGTKTVVERIIPVRSTHGYTDIQLQNRAKVLLMVSSIFDQDLMTGLESIIVDMIRVGTSYSLRSALALLKNLVKQTSRKPYNIIRKYVPLIIQKMNNSPKDKDLVSNFKDLIYSVSELLNGQDISYLNRILDFFSIILKLKDNKDDMALYSAYNKAFGVICEQFEFLSVLQITNKDQQRLRKRLQEIIKLSKARLLDYKNLTDSKIFYLRYWVFSSLKLQQPVAQLLYTEWTYFGDAILREKLELPFYDLLLDSFDPQPIAEDVLVVFFKYLVLRPNEVMKFYQKILDSKLLGIDSGKIISLNRLNGLEKQMSMTRTSISALFQLKDEKLKFFVLKQFIIQLKTEYDNLHSREYVKETCIFIYNLTSTTQKFDIPEWDFLVNTLNLESAMHTISRKLQFVDSTDDIVIILEKSYVNSLLTQGEKKFDDQFKRFSKLSHTCDENVASLCTIILFHVNEVLKSNALHWIHINHWMKYLKVYCTYQISKLEISVLLELMLLLSKLKPMFALNYEYRFYYYSILESLYMIMDHVTLLFIGFDDFTNWTKNFWKFAAMDTGLNCDVSPLEVETNLELDDKIRHLFTSLVSDDAIPIVTDEKLVYELEQEISNVRKSLALKWEI